MGRAGTSCSRTNRPGLAHGAETVDCPYSGHNGNGARDPNVGATSVAFTRDEIKELNTSASSIQIQGKRLPDGVLALSGVEAPPKV